VAEYQFQLNAAPVTVDADPKSSTLEVLREHLGMVTCKAGCMPQGLCGCCTVLIDGKPRLTCTLPVKSVAGKSVTTLEGVPEEDRALLAESFVRAGGTQCGYCTPGIVLSSWALLQGTTAPTREEQQRALGPHLCRCTGYTAIYAAIDRAAALRRGDADPLPPRPRPEGCDVALGDRPYVDDLERPGLLFGGVLFAPVAAGVLTTVDVEAARALDGVAAVVVHKAVGESLTHAGEVVVSLAARSMEVVRAASALVRIEASAVDPAETGPVLARGARADGDVDAALAAAAHVVRFTLRFSPTDPVFLEPEAALAVPVAGGFHLYSPGHDAAELSARIGARVGAPVRVFLVPSGGSYGGKDGAGVEELAVLLARASGRPVRLALGMEEGMRLHPRRPGGTVEVEAGTDGAGTLSALRVHARLDGGASCLAPDQIVAAGLGALAYRVGALDLKVEVHASGNPSGGPVRGAGTLPVAVAVDTALDRLARARGESGRALRARNAEGDAAAVLAALPEAPEGAGIGLARADGAGGAAVRLRVAGPDEVEVSCNVPELGQGRDETLLAALTEVTGLPAEVFSFAWADSASVGPAAPASAPVAQAARLAGHALAEAGGALADRVGDVYVGEDTARAPANVAASLAVPGPNGEVARVHTVVGAGAGQDARLVANLAEGAAHMAMGVALSEEIETKAGLGEGRLRYLGVLKAKLTPDLVGEALVLGGPERDLSEVALGAAAGAVAGLVGADGVERDALPLKDSAAARAAGVRPPRPVRPADKPAEA